MKKNLSHLKHKLLKLCATLTCTTVLSCGFMAFPFADVPLYAATDETAITGDINHDKIVNAADLTLLKYAILKNDKTMLEYGDMTGDGVLNKDDVTVLQEFLLGFYDFTGMLITVGNYDAEKQQLAVSWFTGSKILKYTVWTSNDNCTFIKIADVADESSYTLKLTDQKKKQYFKVSFVDENGDRIESNVIYTDPTESGIACQSVDTDADGLNDMLEKIMRTSPYKADTDDDGLTDYEEYALTNSNPHQPHSVKSGILDADADSDSDGLSNRKEITLKTNCISADTDSDGLSDGDEINKYKSNPLLNDTDGDTLDDSFEIHYALNPLSATTNGVKDAEHILLQSISDDNALWTTICSDDNAYQLSMDIEIAGDAEKMLSVQESSYSAAFENDAQVGKMVDISLLSDTTPMSIKLSFALDASIITDAQSKGTQLKDFDGVQRFSVFKYFEDINMLLPVNTEYDTKNNVLTANISSLGTFCVMNLENWYASFGIEASDVAAQLEIEQTQGRPRTTADAVQPQASTFNKPIIISCVLPHRGESESVYLQQLASIEDFAEAALAKYPSAEIYLCYDKYAETEMTPGWGIYSHVYQHGGWDAVTPDPETKQVHIEPMKYFLLHGKDDYHETSYLYEIIGGSFPRLDSSALEKLSDPQSAVFVFDFQNGREDDYALSYWNANDYCYSWIHPEDYGFKMTNATNGDEAIYKQMLQLYTWLTGGDEITDMKDAAARMMDIVDANIKARQVSFKLPYGSNLKLDSLLSKLEANGKTDTDGDSISDWEEVLTRFIKVNEDGSYDLPSMRTMLKQLNASDLKDVSFVSNKYSGASKIFSQKIGLQKVHPWASNPTKLDTDEDGILDTQDPKPYEIFDKCFEIVNNINFVPSIDFVDEHYANSQKCYCKYGYKLIGNNTLGYIAALAAHTNDYSILDEIIRAIFGVGYEKDFGPHEERKDDDYCMDHAADALMHYFNGTGKNFEYDENDTCEMISCSVGNLCHLHYNITCVMNCAENCLKDNSSIILAAKSDSNLKAACNVDRGNESGGIICDVSGHYLHSKDVQYNYIHRDWWNTVGESGASIVAKISRSGNTYTMTYKYYFMDIYEWAQHYSPDLTSMILHSYHERGLAQEFLMEGKFIGTLTWQAGDDARQMDVVNQIQETLKSKQDPTRWDKSNEYDRLIEKFKKTMNMID